MDAEPLAESACVVIPVQTSGHGQPNSGPCHNEMPARGTELFARLIFCACMAALLFAVWSAYLPTAVQWTEKLLRVLPRFSIFAVSALLMSVLVGARSRSGLLLCGGVLAFGGSFMLQFFGVENSFQIARLMLLDGAVFDLLRFELALLAPILLGIWLGRGIREPRHFIALLLCAAVGDLWMSSFQIADAADPLHPLRLLRLPWPPQSGDLALAPAFTDLLIVAAVLESARVQRFHSASVVAGALAGYAAASFLALGPWPSWTALTMIMSASGILIACWPDLRCNASEAGRAILLSAILLSALAGLTSLHFKLNPLRQPTVELPHYPNAT